MSNLNNFEDTNINDLRKRKRKYTIALFLNYFLGIFGIHRIYQGRYKTGIAILLTSGFCVVWSILNIRNKIEGVADDSIGTELLVVLTLLFLGVWSFIDLINLIGAGKFIDIKTAFAPYVYIFKRIMKIGDASKKPPVTRNPFLKDWSTILVLSLMVLSFLFLLFGGASALDPLTTQRTHDYYISEKTGEKLPIYSIGDTFEMDGYEFKTSNQRIVTDKYNQTFVAFDVVVTPLKEHANNHISIDGVSKTYVVVDTEIIQGENSNNLSFIPENGDPVEGYIAFKQEDKVSAAKLRVFELSGSQDIEFVIELDSY